MEHFVTYFKSILIPFVGIWTLIFQIPEPIYPLSLFLQFFSFIYVRDALLPAGLWTIRAELETGVFEMKFIEDIYALSALCVLCIFNAGLMYYTNKVVLPLKSMRIELLRNCAVGVGFSLLIYYPVYLYRQLSPMVVLSNLQNNPPLSAAVLGICLCGNLVEEVLYRGFLARYLKSYGVSMLRSIFIQASMFAVLHMYLAFIVTDVGVPVLVFTFYEGLICAYLENRYGLAASTVAHGLAIFYFCMFTYSF